MKDYFNGKVVFITGSSKGIGKTTAELFGSFGSIVCLNGRNPESLENTYKDLKAKGVDCLMLPGDVSSSDVVRDMVKKIIEEYGRLDILINNAGVASHGKFEDITPETWKDIIEINTLGSIFPSTYSLQHLIESKGSLVFISTLSAKQGVPYHSAYSVSKMGLTALVKSLQLEIDKKDLHIGILYLGLTENESDKKILYPDGTYKTMRKRNQKLDTREKVAKSIVRAIYKKRKAVTLTLLGKVQIVVLRFFPFIIGVLMKKVKKQYYESYY